jgi:hypothetical protein
MKIFKNIHIWVLLTGAIALTQVSCVDKEFGTIAPRVDSTHLAANTTIAELKSLYSGDLLQLTSTSLYQRDSILIEGIVVSDDKAGNFYKTIVVQDATGGIEVKLDKTTLYNDYPRGSRVVVYCNKLYLGEYGGLPQLGSIYTENGITQLGSLEGDIIISRHVFRKGKTPVTVTPLVLTSLGLTPSNFSKLVSFEDVQFQTLNLPGSNVRLTYADPIGLNSISHRLMSCSDTYTTLVVRSSGFARFAKDTIPSMNGTITGVLSYYNGTYQLTIRDLNDVVLTNPRCN